jgi:hypothetical protein
MLQELAASTGATAWVVASMVFFIGAWVWIAVSTFRARSEDMDACARLAIEGDDAIAAGTHPGTGNKA